MAIKKEEIKERAVLEALAKSEQRFRELAETIQEAFWLTDWVEKKCLYISPAYEKIYGQSCQSLYDDVMSWSYPIHPEDKDRIVREYAEKGERGKYNVEFRVVHPNGKIKWVHERAFPIKENGKIVRMAGYSIDITDRKEAQAAISKSEEFYRALSENASDLTVVLDKKGTINYISNSAIKIFGMDKTRLTGSNWFELVHPEETEMAKKMFHQWTEKQGNSEPHEFRLQHADESWKMLEIVGKNLLDDPAVKGYVMNAHDITDRHRLGQELFEISSRLQTLYKIDKAILEADSIEEIADTVLGLVQRLSMACDRSSIALFEMEEEQAYILSDINQNKHSAIKKGGALPFTALRGIDLLKKGRYYITHNLETDGDRSTSDDLLLQEGVRSYIAYPLRSKGELIGSINFCSYQPNFFEEKHIEIVSEVAAQTAVAIQDSRNQTKLKDSEARFRAIYDQAATGIARIGLHGKFLQANKKCEELFEYTEEELREKTFMDLTHPDDRQLTETKYDRLVGGKENNTTFEKRYITGAGQIVHLRVSVTVVRPRGKPGYFVTVYEDITEAKKAFDLLEASNEELNTFVYKASHDLKGPLASIIGLGQVAKQQLDPENEAMEYLNRIQESTERLNTILTELLAISRVTQGSVKTQKIDLEKLIGEVVKSLEHSPYSDNVKVSLDMDGPISIKTDPEILTSVFQNLVDNAMKYKNPDAVAPFVKIGIHNSKGTVKIDVEDNGSGIPEGMEDKIFEMFYRGHEQSEGTGLGLYIVKKSLEKIQGKIHLEKKKQGTCFHVKLPAEITETQKN